MKTLPLYIVADRGHLIAYRPTEAGALEKIDAASFKEGNQKVSEMVTDQSGAFPVSGSTGTAAYESMPMLAELEMRSFRKIREKIAGILTREKPDHWGFATPSEMNGAVLDDLDDRFRRKLRSNLRLNLTNSPPAEVLAAFHQDGSS
ncbi:MAG: host attachment protein [Verrucomicrobiota bacterium]